MKLIPRNIYLARFKGTDKCPAWGDYRLCQAMLEYPAIPELNHVFRMRQIHEVDLMDQNYWIAMESGSDNFEVGYEVPGYQLNLTLELQTEAILHQISTIQKLIYKPTKVNV